MGKQFDFLFVRQAKSRLDLRFVKIIGNHIIAKTVNGTDLGIMD